MGNLHCKNLTLRHMEVIKLDCLMMASLLIQELSHADENGKQSKTTVRGKGLLALDTDSCADQYCA